jgi:radical SAM family uncharacterized protein
LKEGSSYRLGPFWIRYMLPERLLQQVNRPARYIGREWNSVVKDSPQVRVRMALCYPDAYEIGMSHQGLRILYEVANRRPDAAAERVFHPWPDAAALMRQHGIALSGLESDTPLNEFDLVGITLQHELTYTNVPSLLELGGVSPLAAERAPAEPLVIGGGPCAFNPEPLADFFDAFVIGDGEEALDELLDLLLAQPAKVRDRSCRTAEHRAELVARLAEVEGVYVPSGYELEAARDGSLAPVPRQEGFPRRVARRIIADLDAAPYPIAPVVPYCETVHDRAEIEPARGCTRGCRFCQAGMIYRPVRERSPGTLLSQAEQIIANTGYDEVSLLSLNCPDYSRIEELIDGLHERLADRRVSVSLPSLRVDTFSVGLARRVQRVKKSGLTLAPEAGTQRLRDIINKDVGDDDLAQAATAAFRNGWQRLKLYFMIGLPHETDEDILAIPATIERILAIARKELTRPGYGRLKISVSIASLIPKPHTPFQWLGQESRDELLGKQRSIREAVSNRRVSLSFHDPRQSALEAALARGDRRLGAVILCAYRGGASFDAWSEQFNFEAWQRAFAEHGLDLDQQAQREIPTEAVLPWDVIDTGVDKEFLGAELTRATSGDLTPDCRQVGCHGCGLAALVASCPEVTCGVT